MNKVAFVLMPFSSEFDAAYNLFIKTAIEEAGFILSRADDLLNQRNIMQDVVANISNADLIVADLTGSNANVFYELGIAHALEKPTILLTQSVEELPFDLRSYRVLLYQTHFAKIEQARQDLVRLAKSAFLGTTLFGNPVTDFRAKALFAQNSISGETTVEVVVAGYADDRGFIDHMIDIEEGYGELAVLMGRITSATASITPEANELAVGIGRANAGGGRLAAGQIRFMCQKYAASLDVYTGEIQQVNDEYDIVSERIQDSLEFIVRYKKEGDSDLSQRSSFLQTLISVRVGAVGARDAFASARDAIVGVLEFERTMRRSGLAAIAELDRLVSNISKTISSIERAIDAVGKVLSHSRL